MNFIDLFILAILGISFLFSLHKGFVISLMSAASFILSWLLALIFYPLCSRIIVTRFPDLIGKLIFFTDGSSMLTLDYRSLEVATIDTTEAFNIISDLQLPNPIDKVFASNISNQPFNFINNLGDYLDYTIANIIVNLFSFLLVFLIIKTVFIIIVSITVNVADIPVLKRFDSPSAGILGIFQGILFVFFIFALVPIFLTLAPVDLITEYIQDSAFGNFFLRFNIFSNFVRGII